MVYKRELLKSLFEEETESFVTGSTPRALFKVEKKKESKLTPTEKAIIKDAIISSKRY